MDASDAEDAESPTPPVTPATDHPAAHEALRALLGAWALAACSAEETTAVETHLTDCAACAEEALRLRDAAALLRFEPGPGLDPRLRARVLRRCLTHRPPRIPLPDWAAPYDAETARFDALLHELTDEEWEAPVRPRRGDGPHHRTRDTTVTGALRQLLAVDRRAATPLGLPDPLTGDTTGDGPTLHRRWREQTRALLRAVAVLAAGDAKEPPLPGTPGAPPLSEALLARALACWAHARDVAEAVHRPYAPPAGAHLGLLVDLAVRRLSGVLTGRRSARPPADGPRHARPAPSGRTLRLVVEGEGGGHWDVPLEAPAAPPVPGRVVAQLRLDGTAFCRLISGHLSPDETAAGQEGDPAAVAEVLRALAALARP